MNCESHDNRSDDYCSGSIKFEFNDKIYAHDSVKNALEKAQPCKCCYCESKYRGTSPGEVEHFRPKGAVQQERGGRKEYPGYYWLAYRWENLLVSCRSCNTSKGALFPLSDPKDRAHSHQDDLDAERPLLIDPASEDPRQHIRFRGSAIEPLTERGRETIHILDLRRPALMEDRGEWLDILKHRMRTLDILKNPELIEIFEESGTGALIEEARNFLENAVLPDARYSSMARCLLKPDDTRDDSR